MAGFCRGDWFDRLSTGVGSSVFLFLQPTANLIYLQILKEKIDRILVELDHDLRHSTISQEKTLARANRRLRHALDLMERVAESDLQSLVELDLTDLHRETLREVISRFGSQSTRTEVIKLRVKPNLNLTDFSRRFVIGGLPVYRPSGRFQPGIIQAGRIPGMSRDLPKFSARFQSEELERIQKRERKELVSAIPLRKPFYRGQIDRNWFYRPKRPTRVFRFRVLHPARPNLRSEYAVHTTLPLPDAPLVKWWRWYRQLPPDGLTAYGWSVFTKPQATRLIDRVLTGLTAGNPTRTRRDLQVRRRRVRRRLRDLYFRRYRRNGGYTSRFRTGVRYRSGSDPLRLRHDWCHRYRGSFLAHRECVVHPDRATGLDHRWNQLQQQVRQRRALARRVADYENYHRLIFFGNSASRTELETHPDYLQRRKIRLRRFVDQLLTLDNYLDRTTLNHYQAYRLNRASLVETETVLSRSSFVTYLQELSRLKKKHHLCAKSNTLYGFTHFRRDGTTEYKRHTEDRHRFRGLFKRLVPPAKHRKWRKFLRKANRLRFRLLCRTKLLRLVRQTTEDHRVDRPGFAAAVYASVLDTRRKMNLTLTDRQANSVVRAFRSGLVSDRIRLPALIGHHFRFNRVSITAERDFGTDHVRRRPKFRRTSAFWKGFFRRVKHFLWFRVVSPVYPVYYGVSNFWDFTLSSVEYLVWFGWDRIHHLRTVTRFVWRRYRPKAVKRRWGLNLRRRLRRWDYYRKMVWAYHSWLFAYVMDNDYQNVDQRDFDYTASPTLAEDNHDWSGDRGDEFSHDGGAGRDFDDEQPPSRFFLESPLFAIYDEEKFLFETPREVITDELNYYLWLVVRPVVDVLVTGPFWGAVELFTQFQLATLEYNRTKWQAYLDRPVRGPLRNWFKKGVVLTKKVLHFGGWFGLSWYLFGLLSPDDLKQFVVYSLNWVWHDEYYAGWWWLSVAVGSVVAPGWVKKLIREIYPDNWGFLLGSQASLAAPEGDQPERATTRLTRRLVELNLDATTTNWSSLGDGQFHRRRTGTALNLNQFWPYAYDDRVSIARGLIPVQSYIGREETPQNRTEWLTEDRLDEWGGSSGISYPGYRWSYRWDQLQPVNLNTGMFRELHTQRDYVRYQYQLSLSNRERYGMVPPEYARRGFYRKVETPRYW